MFVSTGKIDFGNVALSVYVLVTEVLSILYP